MTPVNNTIIVAVVVALLAGFIPLDSLLDMVSIGTLIAFIVVSLGVIILRVRDPTCPAVSRCRCFPVTPILSIVACVYILSACTGTRGSGSGCGSASCSLLLPLGPAPQRAQ